MLVRHRRFSLLGVLACVAAGYYLAETGAVDAVRREIADLLTLAVARLTDLITRVTP